MYDVVDFLNLAGFGKVLDLASLLDCLSLSFEIELGRLAGFQCCCFVRFGLACRLLLFSILRIGVWVDARLAKLPAFTLASIDG